MKGKEKDNTILVIDSIRDDAVDIDGERMDWDWRKNLYTATAGVIGTYDVLPYDCCCPRGIWSLVVHRNLFTGSNRR